MKWDGGIDALMGITSCFCPCIRSTKEKRLVFGAKSISALFRPPNVQVTRFTIRHGKQTESNELFDCNFKLQILRHSATHRTSLALAAHRYYLFHGRLSITLTIQGFALSRASKLLIATRRDQSSGYLTQVLGDNSKIAMYRDAHDYC